MVSLRKRHNSRPRAWYRSINILKHWHWSTLAQTKQHLASATFHAHFKTTEAQRAFVCPGPRWLRTPLLVFLLHWSEMHKSETQQLRTRTLRGIRSFAIAANILGSKRGCLCNFFLLECASPADTRRDAQSGIIEQLGNECFGIENKIGRWATNFICMSFQWRITSNAGALAVVEFENCPASAVVGVSGGD